MGGGPNFRGGILTPPNKKMAKKIEPVANI